MEIEEIIQQLENNTLTVLTKMPHISLEDRRRFAAALKNNRSLHTLNLRGNSGGKQGIAVIANALKTNTTLMHLDFSMCNMQHEGAVELAEGLKHNRGLVSISLGSNGFVLPDEDSLTSTVIASGTKNLIVPPVPALRELCNRNKQQAIQLARKMSDNTLTRSDIESVAGRLNAIAEVSRADLLMSAQDITSMLCKTRDLAEVLGVDIGTQQAFTTAMPPVASIDIKQLSTMQQLREKLPQAIAAGQYDEICQWLEERNEHLAAEDYFLKTPSGETVIEVLTRQAKLNTIFTREKCKSDFETLRTVAAKIPEDELNYQLSLKQSKELDLSNVRTAEDLWKSYGTELHQLLNRKYKTSILQEAVKNEQFDLIIVHLAQFGQRLRPEDYTKKVGDEPCVIDIMVKQKKLHQVFTLENWQGDPKGMHQVAARIPNSVLTSQLADHRIDYGRLLAMVNASAIKSLRVSQRELTA